jgi:hypothetical protein
MTTAIITLPERAAPVPTHMFGGWGFHRILPAQRIRVPASPIVFAPVALPAGQAPAVVFPPADDGGRKGAL